MTFLNFSRQDERYHETYNKFSNGYSSSRNYESNTTASIGQVQNSTVADPRKDISFISNKPSIPTFSSETFKLPPEIHQYIQNNSVVNVKIREYDLTVCKDPLSSSISIQIPTINSVQALPAPNQTSNVESFKIPHEKFKNIGPVPPQNISKENSLSESSQDETSINSNASLNTSEKNTSHDSSLEPSQPKKLCENNAIDYDIDDIKVTDISTAGSSLSTEDEDLFFTGGAPRAKLRRLNHRLKKLERRREERREKLKLAAKEEIEAAKKFESSKIIEIEDSDGSTPDEDDFLEMVGRAIKKHNETILKQRQSAERRKCLGN